MKKTLFLAILAVLLTVGAAKAQSKYEGKIGPYDITMTIEFSSHDGDSIGYYYYNSRPNTLFKLVQTQMEAINIHGSMHIVLDEYTPKGNHTGTFDGQFECRGDYFGGTFTNSKGKKYEFDLHEKFDEQ
ncbi:MAG: hypothetical protein J5831_04555 [Bacteroidales bacterium]|nr:hypothetical protein [Bacteroidales bacterium]